MYRLSATAEKKLYENQLHWQGVEKMHLSVRRARQLQTMKKLREACFIV